VTNAADKLEIPIRWPAKEIFPLPMKTKTWTETIVHTVIDWDQYWRLDYNGEPTDGTYGSFTFDKEFFPDVADAILYFKEWQLAKAKEREEAQREHKAKRKAENQTRRAAAIEQSKAREREREDAS
jgi:hypothetical protein